MTQFSNRISGLKASAIREILKFTSVPGVISFAAGNPSEEAIPAEFIAAETARILSREPMKALQYSITEGRGNFRAALADYLTREKGIAAATEQILITSGAQQVAELTAKVLCNEGDVIISESPSFIGSLNAFRSCGARLRGVPMEPDGMDLNCLEHLLKTEKNVRFIYCIPNFQNPTGFCTSPEKRREIYALAKRYGVLILEDNPYEETRFDGESIPSIKSMDTEDLVIYAGSFSKILSPGLRVGYTHAPLPILQKMVVCKQVSDVHTSSLSQMLAHRFLISENFDSYIAKIKEIYRRKANLMMNLAREQLAPHIGFHPVQGGLFLWCSLPSPESAAEFCRLALERSVAVVPGSAFLVDEASDCAAVRLNYSTPSDEDIIKGMPVLGQVAKELFS